MRTVSFCSSSILSKCFVAIPNVVQMSSNAGMQSSLHAMLKTKGKQKPDIGLITATTWMRSKFLLEVSRG
jgi:hypothetical protein